MSASARTEGQPVARLEALADGVFVIAMTLLVLELAVPDVAGSELAANLSALWPKILVYMISFVVLGVYWMGHHYMFRVIRRSNLTLMWLNVLYLMGVAIVPFAAALLGTYPRMQVAVVVYGAVLALAALVAYAMWRYATDGHRLVAPDTNPDLIRYVRHRIAAGPVVSGLAIGISFVSPEASILLYALLPPFYILSTRVDRFLESPPTS